MSVLFQIEEKSYLFEHFRSNVIHFAAIDGVLNVSRDNRIILKGNRLNNLYYLQYLTIDAEVVSIAF
jgi:hypothetical protein